MPRAIEQNVDWITDLLSHVIQNNYAEIGVAQTNAKEWTST